MPQGPSAHFSLLPLALPLTLVLVLLTSCTTRPRPAEANPPATTTEPDTTTNTPPPPGNRTTTTLPPTELPPGATTDAVTVLRQILPMSDPEAACVAQHLDHDPATLTALTALTDPIDTESDAFDTAASIARDCAATITYLPTLVTTINSQHGLTADRQTCLEKALTALDADQPTTLATGGKVDGSTLDQTVEDCGIG